MATGVDAALAKAGRVCDLGTDPSQFLDKFEDWYEEHKLLADSISGITEDQKLSLLLLWGGREFRKFVRSAGVVHETEEEGAAKDSLKTALIKIRASCAQHVNLTMAMYKLMHVKQGTKSVTEFAKEVETLAQQCQLDTVQYTKERAKKDAYIYGTSDERLRQEALAKDMNYSTLLQTATSYEQSRRSSGVIKSEEPVRQVLGEEEVEALVARMMANKQPGKYSSRTATPTSETRGDTSRGPPKCPNCPGHYRPHGPGKCPASGKICVVCRKKNHFAGSANCAGANSKVRRVGYEYDGEDVGRVVEVGQVQAESTGTNHVPLQVNDIPLTFYVDSGCSKTLLPRRLFSEDMGSLEKTAVRFRPYGTNERLQVHGQFQATLRSRRGATVTSTVYVIEGHQVEPLLGDNDAKNLGILQIRQDGGTAERVAGITSSLREAGVTVTAAGAVPEDVPVEEQKEVEQVLARHQQVFEGVGLLQGPPARFHVDSTVTPVAAPYRGVPLAYQERLSQHLQELREAGKIEDVPADEDTQWISNVVITEKKEQGQIRMNVDMREANRALHTTRKHVLTVQEMRHQLKGATRFSEMDMRHGFHQVGLAEESRPISTFRTHEGLHRFKVLFFGPSPAPDLFHERISQALSGLPGCVSIHDNILVWGKTPEEHMSNLDQCLTRLEECGLTLRREKCTFGATSVTWFGWVFSASGMSADPKKLQAIREAGRPATVDDVKSFLQACQFNAKFMFDSERAYAQATQPLRELTHKGRKFAWSPECEASYQEVLKAMTSDTALRAFDPSLPTKHVADAGPDGIASSLFQELPDGTWVPIDHASRALTPAEKNYSQFEKESLAQMWGIHYHRHYLLGIHFETYTDHRPLLAVYNGRRRGNARVERHRLKVQEYNFTAHHLSGKENPCDYTSRHPRALQQLTEAEYEDMGLESEDEVCISTVITNDLPDAVDLKTVQTATQSDATARKLVACIQRGSLSQDPDMAPFRWVFQELMYARGVILRQDRLFIPDIELYPGSGSLRDVIVDLAHEGHQGVVKCKRLLRAKVWFPGMDKKIEQKISRCLGCQATTRTPRRDPLQPSPLPDHAWQHLDADFWGPLSSGEYLLVVVDEYSRYPVVELTRSTSGEAVIPVLDKVFSTHGIPETVKTDGGPPFNGHDFQMYLRWAGCQHRKVSPEDPEANGLAENFMKIIKKSWHTSLIEGKNPMQEMYKMLRQYRATPHSSTGKPPAEVLFNRPYKVRLPNPAWPTHGSQMELAHNAAKASQKHYKDSKANVRRHDIKVGDTVLLLQTPTKQRPWYDPSPYRVQQVLGTQITASRDHKTVTRDAQRFKKVCLGTAGTNRYKKQRYPMDLHTGDERWPDLYDQRDDDAGALSPGVGKSVTTAGGGTERRAETGAVESARDVAQGADRAAADGAGRQAEVRADEPAVAGGDGTRGAERLAAGAGRPRRSVRETRPPVRLRDYVQ